MKSLSSFVFLLLILLNVMGYYGVFVALEMRHEGQIRDAFDQGQYDESTTFTMKIPHLGSGTASATDFERIDGDFVKDGSVYRLIKQRLYRDTFHIIYIEDVTATAIQDALNKYVATFSDKPVDDSQPNVFLLVFLKEYLVVNLGVVTSVGGWNHKIATTLHREHLIGSYFPSPHQPPRPHGSAA